MALNTRITVEQPVLGSDAAGQPLQGWELVGRFWAEIKHPSGVEQIRADTPASIVRASIKVNLSQRIRANMRARHGAAVYDIEAVLPDEIGRQYMFLVCKLAQ